MRPENVQKTPLWKIQQDWYEDDAKYSYYNYWLRPKTIFRFDSQYLYANF